MSIEENKWIADFNHSDTCRGVSETSTYPGQYQAWLKLCRKIDTKTTDNHEECATIVVYIHPTEGS